MITNKDALRIISKKSINPKEIANAQKNIKESKTMTAAEFVRANRDNHGKPMQTFEINGKKIKTNLGAWQNTMWNGNEIPMKYTYLCGGTHRALGFRESTDEAFNKAVEEGYTEIRFVETSTRVRGYHNEYVWLH